MLRLNILLLLNPNDDKSTQEVWTAVCPCVHNSPSTPDTVEIPMIAIDTIYELVTGRVRRRQGIFGIRARSPIPSKLM